MTTYLDSLSDKNFKPNIVVYFMGAYFSVHQPDSGLTIDADKVGLVKSLVVNPTTVDPSRASTTISSITFSLLDRAGVITALFTGQDTYLQGKEVLVYLGRVNASMAWADYFLLPRCYVNQCTKSDGSWNFSTQEKKDRINRTAFSVLSKLTGNILAATTTITVEDVSDYPTAGLVVIEDEVISYTGVDLGNNFLTGCVRGERGTVAAAHALGKDVDQAQEIEGNPLDILISLLVSSGGGGVYDTLDDGAAIDESLVDIEQIEYIRDTLYLTATYDLLLTAITSLQTFIETELLYPLGLRLRTNANSKIGLAVLNRTILDVDSPNFDADNTTKNPNFKVTGSKIYNRVRVLWDWDDGAGDYLKSYDAINQDSIDEFGEQILEIPVKGLQEHLDGLTLATDIADQFLKRFAFPLPEIDLAMHMDASTALIGNKVQFESDLVVDKATGLLGLEAELEVVSRAINVQTGDVTVKLAFTWYSSLKQCFISPTDAVVTVVSQSRVTIATGRTDMYRAGWVMRLWDTVAKDYATTETNIIDSFSGDDMIFTAAWAFVLTTSHRIVFADYNQVTAQQRKFCFISDGVDFDDGRLTYQITS